MTPAQSAELEQRARELLAREYEREYMRLGADDVRIAERLNLLEDRMAVRAIVAALAAAPAADGWMPIESAPKDAPSHSIRVLVWLPQFGVQLGQYTRCEAEAGRRPWVAENFSGMANDTISHWMPLPAAPQAQGEG